MRITVLGKSPAWQDAGGACSGYLVEDDGHALMIDCGNGAFAKLRERIDYTTVDAVVISHLHADHFFDLIPYAYGLILTPRQQPVPVAGHPGTDDPARPLLIAPLGASATFRAVAATLGDEALIETGFHLTEYETASTPQVGPFRIRFAAVPHYVTTHAIEVTSTASGGRCTFGADCSPNDEIVEFARDTDLLVIEATLPRPERTGIRGHLTATEAGEHARRAGAKRVVLTHFSDELDPDTVRAEGAEGFRNEVELASDGAVFEL